MPCVLNVVWILFGWLVLASVSITKSPALISCYYSLSGGLLCRVMKLWFIVNESQTHHSICLVLSYFKTPDYKRHFPFQLVSWVGDSWDPQLMVLLIFSAVLSFCLSPRRRRKENKKKDCNFQVVYWIWCYKCWFELQNRATSCSVVF